MSRKKKKVATAPIELEVLEVRRTPLRRFLVTAYSSLPADRLKEEPDMRVEADACSGSVVSMQLMQQFRKSCYYYLTVKDITPARKRGNHAESLECDEERLSEEYCLDSTRP